MLFENWVTSSLSLISNAFFGLFKFPWTIVATHASPKIKWLSLILKSFPGDVNSGLMTRIVEAKPEAISL